MIAAFHPRAVEADQPNWYYYLDRKIPHDFDPDKRVFEVINGVEVEKVMGAGETWLAHNLYKALLPHLQTLRLGEVYLGIEIQLPAIGAKRKPDVCYVSFETWPADRRLPDDAWWPVTPDLAVEIISPYELTHASVAKVQEYFAAGVKAVWLVLPNVEHVYCYTSPTAVRILTRDDVLTGDPVVPGFKLPLADLFPPAEPVAPTP